MKAPALMAAILAALLCLPSTAQAQVPCGPSKDFMRTLFQMFGERPFVRGINESRTHIIEMVVNPETRTWSIVIHQGNTTCIVANGEEFGRSPAEPTEDEAVLTPKVEA